MLVTHHDRIRAIRWTDGALELLDQRQLPHQEVYLKLTSAAQVADAIRTMVVRGAPAIGIAAAYGVVLGAQQRLCERPQDWRVGLRQDLALLAAARPTAVNLSWALRRMEQRLERQPEDPLAALFDEAERIHQEDIFANQTMGELGATLLGQDSVVLTHCNTGSLATGGYGTALGVIRRAYVNGRVSQVYADETRPWLQGSRLTAWELARDEIPVTLIADGAAAWLMARRQVDWVIVGADRIAANGDVANKIGTYSAAVAARQHGVKFMVVAPTSTLDLETPSGVDIPIEDRPGEELLRVGEQSVGLSGATVWNPVFDVTPAQLIDAIVTEHGVVRNPNRAKLGKLLGEVRSVR